MTPLNKPKSRLEAHAPQCARCKTLMKVFRVARSTTYPTTARNAEERSFVPCHARSERRLPARLSVSFFLVLWVVRFETFTPFGFPRFPGFPRDRIVEGLASALTFAVADRFNNHSPF